MITDTAKISTATRIVRRPTKGAPQAVSADICVLGAGIAGISAALEAARLGGRVALVDGLPALGGQAVNSVIGTFCGLFANGLHGYQFTHGIADDILRELGAAKRAALPPRRALEHDRGDVRRGGAGRAGSRRRSARPPSPSCSAPCCAR